VKRHEVQEASAIWRLHRLGRQITAATMLLISAILAQTADADDAAEDANILP
jgi:hypothetical protein